MSDSTEAAGVQARIALVDRDIARLTDDLKSATGAHWKHHHEHELYDALRRKDLLEARLAMIEKHERNTK